MKMAIFSAKTFEKPFLIAANQVHQHELVFFEAGLNEQTAVLAAGFPAVSCFVTDNLSASVLNALAKNGTRLRDNLTGGHYGCATQSHYRKVT